MAVVVEVVAMRLLHKVLEEVPLEEVPREVGVHIV